MQLKLGAWGSRSTVFAAFFSVTSFVLALKGLLTGQYIAMCTAVQAMIVTRAIAQDHHERCMKEGEDQK